MNEEISKICRICLAEGSQNIFHNNRRNVDTISSLDRILEKLRFVTMLKVNKYFFKFVRGYAFFFW